jgi:AcrR family transcriptional regulator
VKAPTLYHHVGDKRGLIDAVVTDAFERYLAEKRRLRSTGDRVVDLRRGWVAHVAFARANPVVYQLMFPDGGARPSAAARESLRLLREGFDRLAAAALREGVTPELATRSLSAALHGVTAAICREPAHREISAFRRRFATPSSRPCCEPTTNPSEASDQCRT